MSVRFNDYTTLEQERARLGLGTLKSRAEVGKLLLTGEMKRGDRDEWERWVVRETMEQVWMEHGRQYIKIEPYMLRAILDTSIEIMGREFPEPFGPCAILLPVGSEVCGIGAFMLVAGDWPGKGLCIHGCASPSNKDEMSWLHLSHIVKPEETIEKSLDGRCACCERASDLIYLSTRIMLCAAFFLADKHELVMPDLTRKEIHKYQSARDRKDPQRMREIKDKAASRNGWVIGRSEIDLPTPRVIYHGEQPEYNQTGRELHHAHIRRGHLRMQPCGKERKDRKLVFLPPTIVRPDLPLDERPIGYRIPDSNLQKEAT